MQHPDYSIDFKQQLYIVDKDQTYDRLEFCFLPKGFEYPSFKQPLSLSFNTGIPISSTVFVDRYSKDKGLWAENYSLKLYEFIKDFNFSFNTSILETEAQTPLHFLSNDSSLTDTVQQNTKKPVHFLSFWQKSFLTGNTFNYPSPVSVLPSYRLYQGAVYESLSIYTNNPVPPIDYYSNITNQSVHNSWRKITDSIPSYSSFTTVNEIFDFTNHPRYLIEEIIGGYYSKGDIIKYKNAFYIAIIDDPLFLLKFNSDILLRNIPFNVFAYGSYFVKPCLVEIDKQSTNFLYRTHHIIHYYDNYFYIPLFDTILPEWIDKQEPYPVLPSDTWFRLSMNDYSVTLTEGLYCFSFFTCEGYKTNSVASALTVNKSFYHFSTDTETSVNINQFIEKALRHTFIDPYFRVDENVFNDVESYERSFYCANSLIISKLDTETNSYIEINTPITNKPNWLLYTDIDSYFNLIKTDLFDYFTYRFETFCKPYLCYWQGSVLGLQDSRIIGFNQQANRNEFYPPSYVVPDDTYPLQSLLSSITIENYLPAFSVGGLGTYPYYYHVITGTETTRLPNAVRIPAEDITVSLEVVEVPNDLKNYCHLILANNELENTSISYVDLGQINNLLTTNPLKSLNTFLTKDLDSVPDHLLSKEEVELEVKNSVINFIGSDFVEYSDIQDPVYKPMWVTGLYGDQYTNEITPYKNLKNEQKYVRISEGLKVISGVLMETNNYPQQPQGTVLYEAEIAVVYTICETEWYYYDTTGVLSPTIPEQEYEIISIDHFLLSRVNYKILATGNLFPRAEIVITPLELNDITGQLLTDKRAYTMITQAIIKDELLTQPTRYTENNLLSYVNSFDINNTIEEEIYTCLGGTEPQLFSTTQRPILKNLKDISYALGLSYEKVEELNPDTQEMEEKDKYINVRLNYPYPNHVPEEETN